MAKKPSEKQMAAFRKLGYSDEQIAEMLEDDEATDRGAIHEWDMSEEEHKRAIKNANADEHKPKSKKTAPVRKPNEIKANLVQFLFECLLDNNTITNCQVTNKERMLHFTCTDNGKEYDLTLIEKREPKEKKQGEAKPLPTLAAPKLAQPNFRLRP